MPKPVPFPVKLLAMSFFLPLLPAAITTGPTYQVSGQQPTPKPNVLFILADDLGWMDTEPYGTAFYETPHIARLAKEAVRFTNAYAASSVCSPTRASIMTGKHPARLQETDWFGAMQPEAMQASSVLRAKYPLLPARFFENLPLQETTLAEAFKHEGYTTFIAGKWHLGETEKYWPENQGFDQNIGGYSAGGPESFFSPYKNPRLTDGPAGEHLPDRLADETIRFIRQHKQTPFFAFFSMYSVHVPLQAPQELIKKYELKKERLHLKDSFSLEGKSKVRIVQSHPTYAAMVESMDAAVGKLITELKASGLYDNTIVVFFSDNGAVSIMQEGRTPHSANWPLRGGKGWLYEGGIREPLLVRWPGHTKEGSVCNEPVTSTDLYPTLLQMAGLPLMPEQHLDASSFVPLLNGKKRAHVPLYWHYPHYSAQDGFPSSAIRMESWKLIHWYEDDRDELFNLDSDPSEKTDLAARFPQQAGKLKSRLMAWLKKVHAVLPVRNAAYQKTLTQ